MKVFAMSGSLREQSWNKKLLAAASKELVKLGVEVDTFDLRAANLPPYDNDVERAAMPATVLDMKTRIEAAQGVLISTPEYNYSYPGVLKNAIDWGTRPTGKNSWKGKLFGLMGATTGPGGCLQALMGLRHVVTYGVAAWATPNQYSLSGAPALMTETGEYKDDQQRKMLEAWVLGWVAELKKRA